MAPAAPRLAWAHLGLRGRRVVPPYAARLRASGFWRTSETQANRAARSAKEVRKCGRLSSSHTRGARLSLAGCTKSAPPLLKLANQFVTATNCNFLFREQTQRSPPTFTCLAWPLAPPCGHIVDLSHRRRVPLERPAGAQLLWK